MSILSRHLIRAHLGPFFFAIFALTGLLFVNSITQRMEDLAGKGLGWEVLQEFLVLSIPHTFALTMPMAVLVSVLYAFGDLTSSNEVTAMKAGGVAPRSILVPMLWMGALAAATMFYFNDQVLPESNHRLKNLLVDINRKSPTLAIREQGWNRLDIADLGDVYHLFAETVDSRTNQMTTIEIVDRNNSQSPRWTYAAHGQMAFNDLKTDLYLTLYDGVSLELDNSQPGGFRQIGFRQQTIPLRGVGTTLDRQMEGSRGDREMTVAMLREESAARRRQIEEWQALARDRGVQAVMAAIGQPVDSAMAVSVESTKERARQTSIPRAPSYKDDVTRSAELGAKTQAGSIDQAKRQLSAYQVEIHKKFALSVACIIFVLVGGPLAMRFPRGGLGVTIAASSIIFAIYWAGLIGGEDLSERGLAPAALTMWAPNLLFGSLGLYLFLGMGRETTTARGGGLDEVLWRIRRAFDRRRRSRVGAEG